MRHVILFSVLLCGLSAGLFSLDLSAGGGMALLPYQEGLNISAPQYKTANIRNNWVDWGIYGFFDAQYVLAEIGYYGAVSGKYVQSNFGAPLDLESEYDNINITYLDLGISVKYPLKLNTNGNFVFIPSLGLNYWINLSEDYDYQSALDSRQDIKKKDWDQLWIKVGLGFDWYVTPKVYLRFNTKLDFPIETEDWKDRRGNIENVLGQAIRNVEATYLGIGGDFSLAVGYRIK
jgi:hypothetical protein